MTTMSELIARIEAQRAPLVTRKASALAAIKAIYEPIKAAGRNELTPQERVEFMALRAEWDKAKQALVPIDARLVEAHRVQAEEEEVNRMLADVHSTGVSGAPAHDRVARVGQEARTYRPDEDPKGKNFLGDVIGAFRGDYSAGQRLGRHIDEERVERDGRYFTRAAGDAGTGAFTGLVVPAYLTELYAPKARARRPFADNCNPHPLPPDGMTVNISQITTGASVALQASEFATVSGTSMDDTLLTEAVQTAAGFQDVSRQAIERGTNIEDTVLQDLFGAHASTLDSTLLNQATTGLAPVSASQTYTNATVDTTAIPATWKAIIQAQNSVEGVLLAQAPVTHVIMHNRRWNWLTAAISASWPVIAGMSAPSQSWGVQLTNEYGSSVRGVTASGLKIVVDANVSTVCLAQATTGGTQDHIYVVAGDECHLWEDPNAPIFIRAEQPRAKDLAITLVVYSFFAYCFRRYANGSVVVNGSGLATPSFV